MILRLIWRIPVSEITLITSHRLVSRWIVIRIIISTDCSISSAEQWGVVESNVIPADTIA